MLGCCTSGAAGSRAAPPSRESTKACSPRVAHWRGDTGGRRGCGPRSAATRPPGERRRADAAGPVRRPPGLGRPGPLPSLAPTRHGEARSPGTLLATVTGQPRCPQHPAVGRPGRTQPPCGRDRSRCRQSRRPGHPARLWPPSPQLAGHVNIPAHAAVVPAELLSLNRKRVQADVPSGLAAPGAGHTRHRDPKVPCRCPAHPWQATSRSGAPAPAMCPCEAGYQQISLSVTALV